MRTQLIIAIVLVFFSSCTSKSNENKNDIVIQNLAPEIKDNTDTLNLKERVNLLKKYFAKLSDKKYKIKFFEVFPDNFNDFKKIFGYQEIDAFNDEFGPLYEYSEQYINVFFNGLGTERNILFKKVIKIASEGKWQADGVNLFKHLMKEKVNVNLSTFVNILSKGSKEETFGFWYFYFDGPHPQRTIPNSLKQVQLLNSDVYKLMVEAHQKVLSDHKVH